MPIKKRLKFRWLTLILIGILILILIAILTLILTLIQATLIPI